METGASDTTFSIYSASETGYSQTENELVCSKLMFSANLIPSSNSSFKPMTYEVESASTSDAPQSAKGEVFDSERG